MLLCHWNFFEGERVLLCFIEPIVGNRGPGNSEPGDAWISLDHHLNYVLAPPNPTSPIFERTQPLTPLTTKGKPWRLRVWASPELVQDR